MTLSPLSCQQVLEDIPEDISALQAGTAMAAKTKDAKAPSQSSNKRKNNVKDNDKKSKKGKGAAKKKKKNKALSPTPASASEPATGGPLATLAKRVAVSITAVTALSIVARAYPEVVIAHALPLSTTLMRLLRCDWLKGKELYAFAGVIAGVHPTFPRGLMLARALQVVFTKSSANTPGLSCTHKPIFYQMMIRRNMRALLSCRCWRRTPVRADSPAAPTSYTRSC